MTRAVVAAEVGIAVPAREVWDYVTDWPRQGEWIPLTRVEADGPADGVGGRIRAWTGLGPLGFWDTMTVTDWEQHADGSARCEVLHTGRVVRGEGEFAVRARNDGGCTFLWWERLDVPGGRVGGLAWRVVGPMMEAGVARALARLARRMERARG